MAKIIFTSRYLKNANKVSVSNYVNYIATRETVEMFTPSDPNDPSTEQQRKLIAELLQKFPESKNSLEYEDYRADPTKANASEFITEALENFCEASDSREIFLKYMAERPGVERIGKHGLFSLTNEEIDLTEAMKTVANHNGIIWTHVVSLRREDAERLGYNNPQAWRNAVIANLAIIAEAHKIGIDTLKWYAAFHNTAHHPHIHLLVYSENIEQGYLTNKGIEEMRRAFARTIFQNEIAPVLEQQTVVRNNIREQARKIFESCLRELSENELNDPSLEKLILKLSEQLKNTKGKKVYGYLQPRVKNTVNEIVVRLAGNPVLQKMYDEWCELEREKHRTYTNNPPQLPALQDNKAFKPIKNAVIRAVLEMDLAQTENMTQEQRYAVSIKSAAMSMLRTFAVLISDSGNKTASYVRAHTDRKLKTGIRRKKQALGLKESHEPEIKQQ